MKRVQRDKKIEDECQQNKGDGLRQIVEMLSEQAISVMLFVGWC